MKIILQYFKGYLYSYKFFCITDHNPCHRHGIDAEQKNHLAFKKNRHKKQVKRYLPFTSPAHIVLVYCLIETVTISAIKIIILDYVHYY